MDRVFCLITFRTSSLGLGLGHKLQFRMNLSQCGCPHFIQNTPIFPMGCIPSPTSRLASYRGTKHKGGGSSCDKSNSVFIFPKNIIIFRSLILVIELTWIFKHIGRNSIVCLLLPHILNSPSQYTRYIVGKFLSSSSLPCSFIWHST